MSKIELPDEFVASLLAQDEMLSGGPFEQHRRELYKRLEKATRHEKKARRTVIIICAICLAGFLGTEKISHAADWPEWEKITAALIWLLSPVAAMLFLGFYLVKYRLELKRARTEAHKEAMLALPREIEALRREIRAIRQQSSNPPGAGSKSDPGFTLVELLAVTAIIALLVAMILPTLAASKSRSRIITCENNLRELGHALLMYEGDFQYLPGAGEAAMLTNANALVAPSPDSWTQKLSPYVSKNTAVYNCPDFISPSPVGLWKADAFGYNAGGSAPMNDRAWELGLGYGARHFVSTTALPSPAQMIALGDLQLPPGLAWNVISPANKQPIGGLNSLIPSRHRGGANMLFADTHVEWARQSNWIERNINARARWNRDHQGHPETW